MQTYTNCDLKVGDRVRVVNQTDESQYPSLPVLNGLEGKVHTIWHFPEDTSGMHWMIIVEFDQPFKQGIIPEGQSAFGYKPTDWYDRTDYCFAPEELLKLT